LLEGERLATIAVLNDMHVGELCSGTIRNVEGESVPPCFSAPGYAHRMTQASLDEVAALGPDLVVANGDLTDRGRPDEVRRALDLLASTGRPVLVTRGNHDRRFHEGGCGEDGDCLRRDAFPERAVGDHALTSVSRVGTRVAVVGLDSCDPETGEGRLDLGGQLAWLDTTLRDLRAEGRIALVCFHHHVATASNSTHPPPLFFGVRPAQGGLDALRTIGSHAVPLVLHGHTHRNYLTRDPLAPATWFLENGAAKEYPAGYALLEVHEDGIVRTFHRPVTDFTREWTRTSAGQVWGRQPDYTRGTVASRSFVLRFDGGGGGPGGPAPSLIGPFGAVG
jgi:3',5'-cyclic AMP phosphodiesterase CpdA